MPEKTNDKGFAMTGSFSSMVVAGVLILLREKFEHYGEKVVYISKIIEKNLKNILADVEIISDLDIERIVYLSLIHICKRNSRKENKNTSRNR